MMEEKELLQGGCCGAMLEDNWEYWNDGILGLSTVRRFLNPLLHSSTIPPSLSGSTSAS
jgi:hypothetical protein